MKTRGKILSSDFSSLIRKTLKPGFFKIKAKKLVAYAKSIQVKQPAFLGEDPIAHPSYANAYITPLDHIYQLGDIKNSDGSPFITDLFKLLHGFH